ncbi:TPR-like protein [Marasmius fiardii PR-910]|nr:TPR-like protein [Marasmius fiardii PR-910]
MGRTKPKKQPISKPKPATTKAPSIESLLEKAQSLVVQCDYELALRFIQRILEQQPSHTDARELKGVVQLEMGDIESANQTFLSLLPPSAHAPSPPPPSAHLYLAQISSNDPQTALKHYQAAIDIMSVNLKGKERAVDGGSDDDLELRTNIVRAFIGQVEIWMDPSYDLCFAPEAEKTCEELLESALRIDPNNSEALQALASVRMSQQRPEEAKDCLEKAWGAWKDLDLEDPKIPPIETRLALVKLFLELSLFTPALLVLHGVMSSTDEEVEAWYLEGWCYFMMAEQAKENGGTLDDISWEELAGDSRDRLETCQLLHINERHPDTPLLNHVRELISKLEALGIKDPMEEEGQDEDEDEWVDEDSADEDGDVEMS